MPNLNPNLQNYIVNKVALAGLNTFDDPKDISDQECSSIENMVFDDGTIYPREGSLLYRAKPSGETQQAFQMLTATNSDGVDYMIAVYGNNFYLDDTINNQWILLNDAFTPTSTNRYYGSANWNNGTTDDRFYFGNGFDNNMKWIMGLTTLSVAVAPADTTVTLTDSMSFPSAGSIIIMNAGVPVILTYTANNPSTGVLTLTGTAGQTIAVDSSVTMPIIEVAAIPKASVFITSIGRLIGSTGVGTENTFNYSVSDDPEDYTVSASITSGGFYTVYKGKGGIVAMTDFGEYFTIVKKDVISRIDFINSADLTAFKVENTSIISGDGIGAVTNQTTLNYMNVLYYPTPKEGIIGFNPVATGNQSSSGLQLISQKINNIVTNVLDFTVSRTAGINQKLFWLSSRPIPGVPVVNNNTVLMYDLIRGAWTVFNNWNAVDIKPVNEKLYYMSIDDGAVYECFVSYQDAQNNTPTSYVASFTTKRFDLNTPQFLTRPVYVYLEGNITLNTTFYVDVLFNEDGILGKQTYAINGTNRTLVSTSFNGGLGVFKLATALLGGLDLTTMQNLQNPAFFRVYLEVSQALRPHNITLRCYSVEAGSQWGVSSLVLMSLPEPSINTGLVMGPTSTPPQET